MSPTNYNDVSMTGFAFVMRSNEESIPAKPVNALSNWNFVKKMRLRDYVTARVEIHNSYNSDLMSKFIASFR